MRQTSCHISRTASFERQDVEPDEEETLVEEPEDEDEPALPAKKAKVRATPALLERMDMVPKIHDTITKMLNCQAHWFGAVMSVFAASLCPRLWLLFLMVVVLGW